VDGEREVGVIICAKVPGHTEFKDVLLTAVEQAKSVGA